MAELWSGGVDGGGRFLLALAFWLFWAVRFVGGFSQRTRARFSHNSFSTREFVRKSFGT